jgi:hypothetical protein
MRSTEALWKLFGAVGMLSLENGKDSLAKRICALRRAYAVGLGHKPSTIQAAAIMRAATLQAQAEAALHDPTITINDRVRLDGAARRAIRDMRTVLNAERVCA